MSIRYLTIQLTHNGAPFTGEATVHVSFTGKNSYWPEYDREAQQLGLFVNTGAPYTLTIDAYTGDNLEIIVEFPPPLEWRVAGSYYEHMVVESMVELYHEVPIVEVQSLPLDWPQLAVIVGLPLALLYFLLRGYKR